MKNETELIENLKSLDVGVQANALMNLLGLDSHSAVPYIIPLLKSSDTGICSISAYVLGELGDEDDTNLTEALMHLLNDPEKIVRSDVIDALSLLLVEEAVPKICELLLKDSSAALVRVSAAEALGEIGNNSNIGILDVVIDNLSEDLVVRRYAKYSKELLSEEN